jgi:zinc/manganese transport system substrate-binding protein/manganese/iron transport system substrate-binding protein
VTGLIQPNQSAHSFDPSAKQLLALSQADAVVINGADLEPWISDALAAANFSGEIIDASTGIELLAAGEAEEDHAAHADEEEHAHGEGDPHIWTSPLNAQVMVKNIASGLEAVNPADATLMEENAVAYSEQLGILNEWIVENFDQVPVAQRLLVTNHDAFTYFVSEYGITFVGSIIPSFDDNAEPSAAELDSLIALIKESGATAVFSESSISPKLATTIANEAGVQVYSGEDALYSDSLGVAGSDGETYITATIHNVTMLMTAWGYPVIPVPAMLS